MAVGPEEDEAGRGGCLWVQVRGGQCTRAEQPRSDGGKDVGEEGSERTEVDTSVTVAAGGEITGISGRGIMPRLIFAGMQALDTKTHVDQPQQKAHDQFLATAETSLALEEELVQRRREG